MNNILDNILKGDYILAEKIVAVNTSRCEKVKEILESYKGEEISFKYVRNENPLKAVFEVSTTESDDEKLIKKVKSIIKADKFGSVLYVTVSVE